METVKKNITRYTETLSFIFLGLAVITSQYSIAASSIGIGGLIILTIIRLALKQKTTFTYKNIIYLAIAFILAQVISSLFSNDPLHSFNNIYRKVSIYIIFFAAIFIIEDVKNAQKFLTVYIIFTALVSTVEIIRFLTDFSSSGKQLSEFRLEYYGYPITNAEIKMLVILIIIPLIFSKADFILNRLTLILLSFPVLITFYLTNARNAILGLFAALLVFGTLKNKYFLWGLLSIIVLFLLIAPLPVKERIISIADLKHPSNISRFMMWETGLKMFKDHPVIGIGDVDIRKEYEKYKKPEFHGEGSHMHNNIVQIAVTTGIIGLIIWFGLMLYIILNQFLIYMQSKSNEFLNILTVISICSMIAFQVSGITEWNFGDAEFAAPLWFSLALAFIAYNILNKNKLAVK